MIGEIRDTETARIAVQASITGHLVVSTLHTNSTAASISRLVDMGVEPYLLGDSLVGIIAQRLVRRLCPECKKDVEATEEEKKLLNLPVSQPYMMKGPCGCEACGGTGYFGRIGVYEIMPISRAICKLISQGATAEEITAKAQEEGMNTLRDAAAVYVKQGLTSFSEMMKITYEADDTN
jgi:type IV pilus assembly protein PilB